jgi:hypothetical protein
MYKKAFWLSIFLLLKAQKVDGKEAIMLNLIYLFDHFHLEERDGSGQAVVD